MDASQVKRLREEQNKAIQTTNDQIDKWKKLSQDYKNLSDCLLTLPNKISHEVMVPFGPLAFMPGQLVHTNEILVLLGDNWFVERSASQASEIAKRRMKEIEKQLEDLQLQKNLLVNRTSFTEEIQQLSEGSGEIQEINEKYDEEKEKEWKIQHKKNVKKYHEELQRKKLENPETGEQKTVDQKIWERLEELERLEVEQNELNDDVDDDIKTVQEGSPQHTIVSESLPQRKRYVRWVDEDRHGVDNSDSSCTESEEETLPGKGSGNREDLGLIHFTHSPVLPCSVETTDNTRKEIGGQLIINSPTDIYKYFMKNRSTTPKSILKSPSFEGKLPQGSNLHLEVKQTDQENTVHKEKAFSEKVIEKVPEMPTTTNMASVPEVAISQQPAPKMSKFKASRLQR